MAAWGGAIIIESKETLPKVLHRIMARTSVALTERKGAFH